MKTTLRTAALLAAVVAQPVSALDQALSDPELAALRGGFTTATGMTVSFGIERATWINGELRAHHELKAGELTLGRSTGILVGAGAASGIEPVVIQNSLNQQVIQNHMIVNVTVTGASLARQWGHAAFLNDQIMRFTR